MEIISLIAYIIIAIFAFWGFKNGFLRGITKLAGWIAALILAVKFGPIVANLLRKSFSISENVINILGGVIVFLGVIIIISIMVTFLRKSINYLHLGFIDRLIGLVLGGIEAMVVIFLLTFAVQLLPIGEKIHKTISEARIINWNNRTISSILAKTKLDKKIKKNKYYKKLLEAQNKVIEEINKQNTSNK